MAIARDEYGLAELTFTNALDTTFKTILEPECNTNIGQNVFYNKLVFQEKDAFPALSFFILSSTVLDVEHPDIRREEYTLVIEVHYKSSDADAIQMSHNIRSDVYNKLCNMELTPGVLNLEYQGFNLSTRELHNKIHSLTMSYTFNIDRCCPRGNVI